jgi:IS1 family transposase
MNQLSTGKRTHVIAALIEGVSINATCRMTGVAKHTVLKLLRDLGCAAAAYYHQNVRNLKVRRLQCDEIWSYVGAKKKNVSPDKEAEGWGDVWTWTAIDADTKLIVSYYMGGRDKAAAYEFMMDCADRIIGRPQITTDAHRPYLQAVEDAFGADVVRRWPPAKRGSSMNSRLNALRKDWIKSRGRMGKESQRQGPKLQTAPLPYFAAP